MSAWNEYRELTDEDPRRQELTEFFLALVEDGPLLLHSDRYAVRETTVRLINKDFDGFEVDLSDGSGFVTFLELPENAPWINLQPTKISVAHIVWYG